MSRKQIYNLEASQQGNYQDQKAIQNGQNSYITC